MANRDDQDDKNELSPDEQRDRFWKRLEGINAGMLGFSDDVKLVPMSHQCDGGNRVLWFIGAAGTHLADKAASQPGDALYVIAEGGGKLYARISGRLELSDDKAKLDDLWNAVASSWFDEGREDPDVRLLKLSIRDAEVWTTTGGAGFLFELAKNKLTGATPDMGEHFTLNG